MHTEGVRVLLELGTGEAFLCRSSAHQRIAWPGAAQGHCSGQILGGQFTRWPGPRGPQCAHTWGLRRWCREAVTWARCRLSIPPLLPGPGASTGQPNAKKKAVPGRHLGVQEKQQALWKPEHTHSIHGEPGRKIPPPAAPSSEPST